MALSDSTAVTENHVVMIMEATLLVAVADQSGVSDAVIVSLMYLAGLVEFFE